MAKTKTLIPCATCGSRLNKNDHCDFCHQGPKDTIKVLVCTLCGDEIQSNQKFECENRNDFYHIGCFAEKIAVAGYINHQNRFDGMLDEMIEYDDIQRPAEILLAEPEPPLVTGILVQMKATGWKLGSIIFGTEPAPEKEACDNASPRTEIVRLEDPKEVKEIISKMNTENWCLSSIIFNTKPDRDDRAPQ